MVWCGGVCDDVTWCGWVCDGVTWCGVIGFVMM